MTMKWARRNTMKHLLLTVSTLFLLCCGCVRFENYGEKDYQPSAKDHPDAALILHKLEQYKKLAETKLTLKYRMAEDYVHLKPTVELIPVDRPCFTEDGKKAKIEFAKIVRDEYGRRIPDLEDGSIQVTAEARGQGLPPDYDYTQSFNSLGCARERSARKHARSLY